MYEGLARDGLFVVLHMMRNTTAKIRNVSKYKSKHATY